MKTKALNYQKILIAITLIVSMILMMFSILNVKAAESETPKNTGSGWDELYTMDLAMMSGNTYAIIGNALYSTKGKEFAVRKVDVDHNATNSEWYGIFYYPNGGSSGGGIDLYAYFDTTKGQIGMLSPKSANIRTSGFVDTYRYASAEGWINDFESFTVEDINIKGIVYRALYLPATYCNADTVADSVPKHASLEDALNSVKTVEANGDSQSVKVSADITAGYTVKMPALFNLDYDETAKRFQYQYTLGVKGCLGYGEILTVVPKSTFTLTNKVTGKTMTGKAEQTVTAFVSDNPTTSQKQIEYGSYTNVTGVVYLPSAYSGDWEGNVVFTFTKTATE